MIKLIVTDVDGTLGPVNTPTIHKDYYPMMEQLLKKGIRIAVASGRQHPALEHLFSSLGEQLIYIADNGAHVRMKDKDLYISQMSLETSHELVRDVIMDANVHIVWQDLHILQRMTGMCIGL